MHSSDETDEPGRVAPASGATTEAETAKLPAHAFRERIRRASVAAAQASEAAAVALPPPEQVPTHSSLPPEHSGVRSRPDEPAQLPTPAPVFVGNRRPTPRAWPFNPGARPEAKRPLNSTQMGLGLPVPPKPIGSQPPPAAETDLEALARAATEPLPQQAAPEQPAPWSPTSTKPQRASLLRAGDKTSEAGRYSMREPQQVDIVEGKSTPSTPTGPTGRPREARQTPSRPLDTLPSHGGDTRPLGRPGESRPAPGRVSEPVAASEVDSDDPAARARRYTPKQRPAQRRGRLHERPTSPGRMKDDRSELTRTLPEMRNPMQDIRSTMPGRPTALQQHMQQGFREPPPTQPKGKLPPRLPPASEVAKPSLPPPAAIIQPESSIVVDPSAVVALQRTQEIAGVKGVPEVKQAQVKQAPSRRPSPAPFVPLPSDREGFEAFMREQAIQRGAPGARLNWNQQETLLIPRESLEPEPRTAGRPLMWVLAGGALLTAIVVLIVILRTGAAGPVKAIPLSTSTSAAVQGSTLIASEPSGAELLQAGAVLGNTPLRVPRPTNGDATFLVRMPGFESQLVRVTSQSNPAIRINLIPAPPSKEPK